MRVKSETLLNRAALLGVVIAAIFLVSRALGWTHIAAFCFHAFCVVAIVRHAHGAIVAALDDYFWLLACDVGGVFLFAWWLFTL